jgi:predicted dehydrogenase
LASKLSVPLYHEIDTLIARVGLDGVIIASPNIFHAEQAIKCINANVPILIEKPISHTYETGKTIATLAGKKSAKVLIGHHRAHSPILQNARDIIKSNQIGKIVAIMGSALFYKPIEYFEAGPWRRELGGGPILINLIHEIGNFRSLCGEIIAVQAMASSGTRQFVVEDTVVINFQFDNGALGTFILSDTAASAKSWEQTSQENKIYPTYSDEDCYHIAGTLGSLSIPTMRLKYYDTARDASWLRPFNDAIIPLTRIDPLKCQLEHFVKLIYGEVEALVTASDGLKNLQITEAISESVTSKKMVYIN